MQAKQAFLNNGNKYSGRARFDVMRQENATMAQYCVTLKKQAAKCKFPDEDDAIRSKILQTMHDRKLRRPAMLENYTLFRLLKEAANREDVERRAKGHRAIEH